MLRAFFSYPRKHAEIVKDFHTFSSVFGGDCFLDERSIPLGADFPDVIAAPIQQCHVFVLFWCVCASESEWVDRELNMALENRKRIVPILMSEFPLPDKIARINGQRLSITLCVQCAFGSRFGAHLFRDDYAGLPPEVRSTMLKGIEDALISDAFGGSGN